MDDEMNGFRPYPKIARLSREIIITEKIDGTNASVLIVPELVGEALAYVNGLHVYAGKRTSFCTPEKDNYGFAKWVQAHAEELVTGLGQGRHFGEWWGAGVQRRYGLDEKRFSLFNINRWVDGFHTHEKNEKQAYAPACCHVVPVLYRGPFDTKEISFVLHNLAIGGSVAAPGFMDPEGIVIFHTASGTLFKKTIKDDDKPKGL